MNASLHLIAPPLEVLLGPASSGKTATCLEELRRAGGGALLLTPSHEYAQRLRGRLSDDEREERSAEIVPFSEIGRELAKTLAPGAEPIRRSEQWIVLSGLFERESEESAFFDLVREAPGFVPALAECIRDLKLSGITAQDLARASSLLEAGISAPDEDAWLLSDPSLTSKTGEIARLYAGYERFLAGNRIHDEEDIYRIAADAAPGVKEGRLAPRLVIVDGFYRVSQLWRDLLAAFARRGARVLLTLPADQDRPLLFATPLRTLAALKEQFDVRERWLPANPASDRPVALAALERGLFRSETAICAAPTRTEGDTRNSEPGTDSASVVVFDAPNAYTEVEMAARALVKENRERGVSWQECAVVARSAGDYAALVTGVFARFGIPVSIDKGKPLSENAAVRTLIHLLQVHVGGWQRDDVIAFLRSEIVCRAGVGFDFVRVLSRARGVRQGREGWKRIAEELQPYLSEADPDSRPNPTVEALRKLVELGEELPAGAAGWDALAAFVRRAVELFSLHRCALLEDGQAMKQALDAVGQLQRHASLSGSEPVTFAQFHRRLTAVWRSLTFQPSRPGKSVSLIEPYDAQQLRPRVVVALGLTERVFPRRVMDDPFFRDDERDLLRRYCGLDLEPRHDRADDERLLFYMAACAATERLILTFPRSSAEADTLPSFYLDEARDALARAGEKLPAVVRTLADVAPPPEDCVTDHDRLLAACAHLGDAAPGEEMDANLAAIVATRERPPDPALTEHSTTLFGAPHRYNVTEIETYNRCPFQHFARYGLKLRAEADGAGRADRGALHHDVLRRTLRQVSASGEPPERKRLTEKLVREMLVCLNERAVDARPHRRELMERAVRAALEVCAEREERYHAQFGMTPAHFELAFGMGEVVDEEGDSRDYDPASSPKPLIISGAAGEVIHLCGAIDRVDLAADGRTAMVLDYKMGRTQEWARIKEGESIQIPLYLLAVEQVWNWAGAVGCYDSPRDDGRRRFYRREMVDPNAFKPIAGIEDGHLAKPVGPDEFHVALAAAQQTVRSAVSGMRSGRITPTPGEHCRWCDYSDICRPGEETGPFSRDSQ